MKSKGWIALVGLVVVLGLLTFAAGAFVVREDEQAVITQFGEPVRTVREAGLHFRTPFLQEVRRFDRRILEFDGDPNKIQTNDKKRIYVDTFARWRISDPEKFLVSVRTEAEAQSRLDDLIDSATRTAIARHYLVEAVRNSNRALTPDKEIEEARRQLEEAAVAPLEGREEASEEDGEAPEALRPGDVRIEVGREKIMEEILDIAAAQVGDYGIELVDVRIKRINYGSASDQQVRRRVYERMASERRQIAQVYRSEGEERRAEWLGKTDREKNQILSKAYREAEEIKGEGEAEAARIYARAYGKDPDFYAFWKTLQLYPETLGDNGTLVISTDSDLFRYLNGAAVFPLPEPSEEDGSQEDSGTDSGTGEAPAPPPG